MNPITRNISIFAPHVLFNTSKYNIYDAFKVFSFSAVMNEFKDLIIIQSDLVFFWSDTENILISACDSSSSKVSEGRGSNEMNAFSSSGVEFLAEEI